jgi:hypothetical protein
LRQAQLFHRIAIGPHSAGSNWTLFAHFKRTRRWGFLTNEGWLDAKAYGDKYSCPVEEEGVDYEIRGRLFPRVVELGK